MSPLPSLNPGGVVGDVGGFLERHWWVFLIIVAALIIFLIWKGIRTRTHYDAQWYQDIYEDD